MMDRLKSDQGQLFYEFQPLRDREHMSCTVHNCVSFPVAPVAGFLNSIFGGTSVMA